ncbi:MAG: MFS transporter [Euryarchaeota archaeon]|nr:MFS transporter [Euryarchaeota archaeon]
MSTTVLVLGAASFLADVSSEMIFAVLPFFYLSLGIVPAAVGLIEGIAESTASLLKVYSGWYSDKVGRRKIFVTGGYGLSAASKVFFALAATWLQVLAVRFVDRVGKGLRTSPRDALIADSTDAEFYGKSFGFHRAMDTSGAVLGIAVAFSLVAYFSYRRIFLIAAIPAFLSVLLIIFFVREIRKEPKAISFRLTFKALSREFKIFLLIATIFGLANFSYVFLMWKAKEIGIPEQKIIIFYLLFSVIYATFAMPAGMLSDRIQRKHTIALGYALFGFTCTGFMLAKTMPHVLLFFALYGIYYAFMEGIQKAYVADLVPAEARGTAFGIFHTILGIAALPASLIAGALWQYLGASATFLYGAVLAFLAAVLLIFLQKLG